MHILTKNKVNFIPAKGIVWLSLSAKDVRRGTLIWASHDGIQE
jgi:hypothetical protein